MRQNIMTSLLFLILTASCGSNTTVDVGNAKKTTTQSGSSGATAPTYTPTVAPSNTYNPTYQPSTFQNPPVTPVANIDLSLGSIFYQGNTNWCWAFAAFHALRGYYFNTSDTDATVTSWKNALSQINSQQAFTAFLSSMISPMQAGNPSHFFRLTQSRFGLSNPGWSEISADYGNASSVFAKIDSNLARGIPSVWCDSEHCLAITKVDQSNSKRYYFSDSMSGTTYPVSAQQAIQATDIVMVFNR